MTSHKADHQSAEKIVQYLTETYQLTISGDWSLDELQTLQQAVQDLAKAMGGANEFVGNIGILTISEAEMEYKALASAQGVKLRASPISTHGINYTAAPKSSSSHAPTSIDTETLVHELAHVWDANSGWRLSKALQGYTGGRTNLLASLVKRWRGQCDEERRLPGCNRFGYFYGDIPPGGSDPNFNRKEDFAESVTAYVYPSLVQARVERFGNDDRYRDFLYYQDYTQTRRWEFIDGLLKGNIVIDEVQGAPDDTPARSG